MLHRLPFFYGWVVIAVAFITMGIAITGRTSFSLLYPEILTEFGWGRGTTASAFSIGFVASTAMLPLVGVMMDRFGPRVVIPFGALLTGIGFWWASTIESQTTLILSLGLLAVNGSMAMSFIVHAMFLPNWFVRNRGLALGLAFSGVGILGAILLPAIQAIILSDGWRAACVAMAVVSIVVLVPLNAVLQREHPKDLSLEPDGGGSRRHGPSPDNVVDREWTETPWTLRTAARTARFWWVFLGFFFGLFVWYAGQTHQTKLMIDLGFDPGFAAAQLGLAGLFGVIGQIWIGAFSDRYGREIAWTVALSGFVIVSVILAILPERPEVWLVWTMTIAMGLLGYGQTAIFGAIASEIFAGPRFASIFAVIGLGGNLGAAAGAWALGAIYDATGAYAPGFWLAAGLSLCSMGCIWMAAPRRVRLVAGQARRRAERAAA